MDSKKSPLALLAQTCSQIGVDSSNNLKPIVLEKSKRDRPPSAQNTSTTIKSEVKIEKSEIKLAFKPYETNVLTKESHSSEKRVPSRNSEKDSERSSTSPTNNNNISGSNNNNNNNNNISKDDEKEDKGASPIIRSGLEVLQGKDNYRPYLPHGFETNPAFRSPYLSPHHAAMLAAAAYQQNPYMSYARIKTPSGAEAVVPICKDPYCTGCQFSAHNQQMLMGTPCPQGCTQCDHQKYLAGGYRGAAAGYACSWPIGGTYCGKRFDSTEELFAHVRTHSPADPALLNPLLFSQSAALRSMYTAPPTLSPLSAARYHPYGKPGMTASPYSAFNPALQYYSPYAAAAVLYSQRMGSAP